MTKSALAAGLLLAAWNVYGQSAASGLRSHWPVDSAHPLFRALGQGPGFSFAFDKQRVGPALPAGWTAVSHPGEITFRHTSGLVARQSIRAWKGFDAVEYTVRFRNEGRSKLPILGPVNALDFTLYGVTSGLSVVSSAGGMKDATYPPASYTLRRRYFGQHQVLNRGGTQGAGMTLTTEGGRSSNLDLPFFFIENEQQAAGMFVAIGWPGQWAVHLVATYQTDRVAISGGMPGIGIQLEPGEEISGPTILLGCYRGDLADGSNRLRRLIRTRYAPKVDGRELGPIAVYDTWWNINVEFDEALLRRLATAAAAAGQEYFLLDAGWFAGAPDTATGFGAGVGNWDEVDRKKLPGGLRPLAQFVRTQGMQFGLWFEPERVARGSRLPQQHPDWVIWLPASVKEEKPYVTRSYGVLDYSRADVRDWVAGMMEGYIRDLDVRYVRHDFNLNPLAYWTAHDPPGRAGISQIRHMEGLRQVIERLRERNPRVVMEGCASGGRRIDLESLRTFHTTWIGDHTLDPRTVRWNLHGLNHFLPGNYLYVCYSWPMPYQKPEDLTAASLGSFFGGAFGSSGRLDKWTAPFRGIFGKYAAVHKQLRRFLMEDYYPLTPQGGDDASWAAWQFHDPRTGEGFVQAFRLTSREGVRRFHLRGLDPAAAYDCTDPITGNRSAISGAGTVEFRLDPGSSGILAYRRQR